MKKLILIFIIAFSQYSFAIDTAQVRLKDSVDESRCKFIAQVNCTHTIGKCLKWHKKKAASYGADSFVYIDDGSMVKGTEVNVEIRRSFRSAKKVYSLTADYFKCGK